MADKSASPAVVASSPATTSAKAETPKKAATAQNPKAKPTHPSTADMVNAAIKTLAERNGSSLQAIKKYIATTYKLDAEKLALFIRKYLKSAVIAGTLVQTKGKGASGSFKLAVKKSEASKAKPKTTAAQKAAGPKKAAIKKPAAKKTDAAKAKAKKETAPKQAAVKKPAAEKKAGKPKAEVAAKSKSPKAKKATKGPTAKPKAPKPKKASAPKARAAPKRSAAAKK